MNTQDTSAALPEDSSGVRHRRNFVWLMLHTILYLPFRVWFRIKIVGKEHLDPNQGGILLVNHQSFLDPLFVAVRLTRPVSYLARDSLFRIPFIGWVCRNTYVIPISRTAFRGGSVRTAMDRLNRGFLVGIYPEGTRSSGAPKDFRPGFLSLVRRTDVPVYPVAINGADRAMPRGAWFIRPAKVTVVYGKPLTPEESEQLRGASGDKQLAAMIRDKVAALYDSADPTSGHGPEGSQ